MDGDNLRRYDVAGNICLDSSTMKAHLQIAKEYFLLNLKNVKCQTIYVRFI